MAAAGIGGGKVNAGEVKRDGVGARCPVLGRPKWRPTRLDIQARRESITTWVKAR